MASTSSTSHGLRLLLRQPRSSTHIRRPISKPILAACSPPTTPSFIRSFTTSQPHHSSTTPQPPPDAQHTSTSSSTTHPQSSTVSPQETAHFSALASTWWDPHGSSGLLHLMNPLRHDFIRHCLTSSSSHPSTSPIAPLNPTTPNSLTYLDIGCGGGIFAESCARLPTTKNVTGVDPTPLVLSVARQHAKTDPLLCPDTNPATKLRYLESSIENLSQDETADILTLFEVIEHVASVPEFLDHAVKHVRPGGWIIGSTIARTAVSWFTTKFMAEDVLRIVPRGTHDWGKYVDEGELRGEFAKMGNGWGEWTVWGVVYVPGFGWKRVSGAERVGNYFWGVRRCDV